MRNPTVISNIDSVRQVKILQSYGICIIHILDGGDIDTVGCDHSIRAMNFEELQNRIDSMLKLE